MKLQEQINRIHEMMGLLTEVYNPNEVRYKYVDEKKIVTSEKFDELKNTFKEYQQFIWILKKLESNCISYNKIPDFVEYFKIFDKHKKNFPIKDLGQIKTCSDVKNFISISNELIDKISFEDEHFINFSDIKKLNENFIEYMGVHSGYQVFVIPHLDYNLEYEYMYEPMYKAYKNILGDCENRNRNNYVRFCTLTNKRKFVDYINKDYLVVFHQKNNPETPIQISPFYDSECKNKNNKFDEFSDTCEQLMKIARDLAPKAQNNFLEKLSKKEEEKELEKRKKEEEERKKEEEERLAWTENITQAKIDELESIYAPSIVDYGLFEKMVKLYPNYEKLSWLLKRMELGCISYYDVENYIEYFTTFENKRDLYPIKNLKNIKICDDVYEFVRTSKNLKNSNLNEQLNRIHEMMGISKDVLTEGRYSQTILQIWRDIKRELMDFIRDEESTELEWEEEYFQEEFDYEDFMDDEEYDDEEEEEQYSTTTFTVRLTAITEDIRTPYDIHAEQKWDDEDSIDVVNLQIYIDTNFKMENLNKLFAELKDVLRHEIEHLYQSENPYKKVEEIPTDTFAEEVLTPKEKDAYLQGFYTQAKTRKMKMDDIIDEWADEREELFSSIEEKEYVKKELIKHGKKLLPQAKWR